MLHRITPMTAYLTLAIATVANAQSDSAHATQSVSAASAITQTERIDASASPRPFGGTGLAGSLQYRRDGNRWTFAATLIGSHANYRPSSGENLSATEQSLNGRLELAALRRVAESSRRSIRVGVALESSGDFLTHRYTDPNATSSSYITAFSTLGPAASWRESVGGGAATVTATIPVAGVAHQPYGDTRIEHAGPRVNTIGPREVHGLDFTARYETSRRSRAGIMAEYRLHDFDYTGGWRVRTITNATAVGIVMRFGHGAAR